MDGKWYALFVVTGEEDNVRDRIHFRLEDQIRAIVPKRKLRERHQGTWEYKIRILFPGYVLLNGRIDTKKYCLIRDIPGVIRLLHDGDGPHEINQDEISIINSLTTDDEIIGCSNVFLHNDRIKVIDGPLHGLEGLIRAYNRRKGRVKVTLGFVGETKTVDLCVNLVQPENIS